MGRFALVLMAVCVAATPALAAPPSSESAEPVAERAETVRPVVQVVAPKRADDAQGVVAGGDLTAWQVLEQRRLTGVEALDAYRAFLLLYSDSPFAVTAYGRLVELDGLGGLWIEDPAVKATVASVRRAWEDSQRAIAAQRDGRRPIATIEISDGFVEAP